MFARLVLLSLVGVTSALSTARLSLPYIRCHNRCYSRLIAESADDEWKRTEQSRGGNTLNENGIEEAEARGGLAHVVSSAYSFAAGGVAVSALNTRGAQAAMLASTALAMMVDFGPVAVRDLSRCHTATNTAVNALIDASPTAVLVNNFVQNLGADKRALDRERASARLAAAHRWGLLVHLRAAGDVVGVLLILSGRTALGSAALLSAHALFWANGAAGARVDSRAEPAPLSPPLARIIGATAAVLAALATLSGYARGSRTRALAGWTYAAALVAVEAARIFADRVRSRTHVGL